jgi:hypothetical protein
MVASRRRVALLKRPPQAVMKNPKDLYQSKKYKTVLDPTALSADDDGIRRLTKDSYGDETSKGPHVTVRISTWPEVGAPEHEEISDEPTGDCIIRFTFPPPKEDAAAAAAQCPNRGARLAEANTLQDLSRGVFERNLKHLKDAMEDVEELFHESHGKSLAHHLPFVEGTVAPLIKQLTYEHERAPIDAAVEKRDLKQLEDALARKVDLSDNPHAEDFRSLVETVAVPLVKLLTFEAAKVPLQAAINKRDQNALEEAITSRARLSDSPYEGEYELFVRDNAMALLDLVTLENEMRDHPDSSRLYLVPRDVFVDMQRPREDGTVGRLVVFQDLRKQEKLKEIRVGKKDVLRGALREKYKVLAISYPWQGFGDADSTGERMATAASFLEEHQEFEYVWWDFLCVPQNTNMPDGEGNLPEESIRYPTDYRKTNFERLYCEAMINQGGVSLIYLGASVLSIANASYLHRFWTQYEYMLATRSVTQDGFTSSCARSYVSCIQSMKNSTAEQEEALRAKWDELGTAAAQEVFGAHDTSVTNKKDKKILVKSLPKLEKLMIEVFKSLESEDQYRILDEIAEDARKRQQAKSPVAKKNESKQHPYTFKRQEPMVRYLEKEMKRSLSGGEAVNLKQQGSDDTADIIRALKKRVANAEARAKATQDKIDALNTGAAASGGGGGRSSGLHKALFGGGGGGERKVHPVE